MSPEFVAAANQTAGILPICNSTASRMAMPMRLRRRRNLAGRCPNGIRTINVGRLEKPEFFISLRCPLVAFRAVGGSAAAIARNDASLLAFYIAVDPGHP